MRSIAQPVCKDLHGRLTPEQRSRFFPWLLACEKVALAIEGVAHHYLQDAWAIGHMFERWGSTEIADFRGNRALGFAIGGFVGATHGSKAMLDDDELLGALKPWDDAMNAPHPESLYVDFFGGGLLQRGVGDRFLPELLGEVAPERAPFLGDLRPQREALFGCAVSGLRSVYAASAQLHGPLAPAGSGLDASRSSTDATCWSQRVTNQAFDLGLGVDRGPYFGRRVKAINGVVAWTLGDVLGNFLLDAPQLTAEVKAEFLKGVGKTVALAGILGVLRPHDTDITEGGAPSLAGIGPNSRYARGLASLPRATPILRSRGGSPTRIRSSASARKC